MLSEEDFAVVLATHGVNPQSVAQDGRPGQLGVTGLKADLRQKFVGSSGEINTKESTAFIARQRGRNFEE